MSQPPALSIIIVSYNTARVLRGCLASLLAAAPALPLEVLVIDNASTDGSAAMVARDFPTVRLLPNSTNVGFARACNQGIAASSAPLLLLLNPDTFIPPGALAGLLGFVRAYPDAGACSPLLLTPDGSAQAFAFGGDPTPAYLLRRGLLRLLLGRSLHPWRLSYVRAVDWVSGACLLVRRAAIEQAGLLDEQFFLYFEDVDWCLRIRRQGWRVYYVPQVAIIHAGGRSLARNPAARHAYTHSLARFYHKHYSLAARLWLRAALLLYRLCLRLLRGGAL
jgi:hypothetical protein